MPVAIVAIVAMFFAWMQWSGATVARQPHKLEAVGSTPTSATTEVILYIDPPRIMEGFPPPLPTRNPLK
jgi:hypothetical protein